MYHVYDLRGEDNPLSSILQIEQNHGIGWENKRHSLTGFLMTMERANEFIALHNEDSMLACTIHDYGVTVYLKRTANFDAAAN